jgi:serine/threonine-protein kinase
MLEMDVMCLDRATLAALLAEALSPRDREDLERHLDACPACQTALLDIAGPIHLGPTPETPDLDDTEAEAPSGEFVESLKKMVQDMVAAPRAEPVTTEPEPDPENASGPTSGLPRLPGLEVLEEIGRGGMGTVYRAIQKGLGRVVAVKVIDQRGRDGADRRDRAHRGAETLARLEHPHIVRIHHVGEHEHLVYGVLEHIAGGDLRHGLRDGPWPIDRAVEFVRRLADAVGFLHENGVVHGDLKPENVLIAGPTDPRLADFGIARYPGGPAADGPHPHPHPHPRGTPGYMAPEQARGQEDQVGPPTDVHALGAILHEVLTGRPPFAARSRALLIEQVCLRVPEPPSRSRPEVPAELDAICARCLAKAPADRYPDAGALAHALRNWLEHHRVGRAVPVV